jgi:polyvinyl alcohol dehydrogenase (cytochrome)
MKTVRSVTFLSLVVSLVAVLATTAFAAGGGGLWLTAGGDRENTRNQNAESKISPANVGDLTAQWVLTPVGNVSATPAVEDEYVYVPDWAGNLFKADRRTGEVVWSKQISEYTGVSGDFARTTPAIYNDMLIFGDQGGQLGAGARVMAVDKNTGEALWVTQVDAGFPTPGPDFSIITQSATVFDGLVYVGVSSFEEFAAGVNQGYQCCSFQGRMLALDANTGAVVWQTRTVPDIAGYSGNAVWGSAPVVDTKRNSVYIATGNNYSVPQYVQDCVATATTPEEQRDCLDEGNYFDAVVALDRMTGEVKWATPVLPFDSWNVACLPPFNEINPENCPNPESPDFDFGQAPILYRVKEKGMKLDLLGIGQKSGQFWALDADSGEIVWSTQVSPGGVAGGMMWGSAYDGERLYTSSANSEAKPWTLTGGGTVTSGGWSALDPATGEILWQTANPTGAKAGGAVTVANGVVYACSMDAAGHMYALDAGSGTILWDFASGGSCNAGAAVVNGTVYWGSGYIPLAGGTPNDKFYAFGVD